jgi:uncharacterized caspase-like protein/Flp pilus assembly protein TadD
VAKVALLIGVSQYTETLNPLPASEKDVKAMQRILEDPNIGKFDFVDCLVNPDLVTMQRQIGTLFSERTKDDLVVLFFSGHGIKDERGRLYFATPITCKRVNGELEKATAIPASTIQDFMKTSRCRRQVIILDCCFSGAFQEGMISRDDGMVDVRSQLGGEGTVVLTSSTSTQYSFETKDADLSIYTRYLVEGIETGAADQDHDGFISVDELHEYAEQKVQEAAPAMKPEIHIFFKQGYKILLAKAPVTDPKLRYRIEADRFASRGEISPAGRYTLDTLRERLSLSLAETAVIEADVLRPYQEYKENLRRYKQAYEQELLNVKQTQGSISELTRADLAHLQQILGLRDEDTKLVEDELSSRYISEVTEGLQKKLAETYTQALSQIQDDNWAEAIQLLQEIVRQQPDYRDAGLRLSEAKTQQKLTRLGAEVEQAYADQNWTEIIRILEAIKLIDPSYRNAGNRLDAAIQQQKLANLYERARQFYAARRWQQVIDEFAKIHTINKAFPDPGGFWTSALQKLRQEEQQQQQQHLLTLYNQGQRCIAKKNWKQAIATFREIQAIDPNYRDVRTQLQRLHQLSQNIQSHFLIFVGLIFVGWFIACQLASWNYHSFGDKMSLLGGSVGGALNGLIIALALNQNYIHSIERASLRILLFSLVGGLIGICLWSVVQYVNRNEFSGGFIVQVAVLSSLVGCSTLLVLKLGLERHRS